MQSGQHLVLSSGSERLETGKETTQRLGKWQQDRPGPVSVLTPSYLGVLNEEAGAVAVGALGTLPAASTADAAHAALTAHAIPVTCCRGQTQRG